MTLVRQTQIYPIDLITYLRVDPKLIPHCLILSQDKKKIESILIILRKKMEIIQLTDIAELAIQSTNFKVVLCMAAQNVFIQILSIHF